MGLSESATGGEAASSALRALAVVAERHGIDLAPEALRRARPFPGAEPSNALLSQLAADNGLQARAIRLKPGELGKLGRSLPAVLRMPDGRSLVLVQVQQSEAGRVAVLRDPFGADTALAAIEESRLFETWQGDMLLVKRSWQLGSAERPFGFVWLLGEVLRERQLFRDIGLGALISSVFVLMPPMVFLIVLDRVLVHQSSSTLTVLVAGLTLVILFDTLLGFARRYFIEVATSRIDGRLMLYVFDRLLNLPLSFFERSTTGTINAKIGEIWRVRNFLTGQLFGTMIDGVSLFILVPVLFVLNWKLALLVMLLSGLVALTYAVFIPSLRRAHARVVKAEQALGSHQVETIHGIKTVKSLALDGLKRRERDIKVARLVEARTALAQLANYPQTIVMPIERFVYVGSMALACVMVLSGDRSISAGVVVAFSMIAQRVASPLIACAALLQSFEEVRAAVAEVGSVINSPAEGGRSGTGLKVPIRGAIRFESVRFRYAPDAAYALDEVSFEIPRGTIFGVMGRSGSGKTTVTRLLQGLHRDYEGMIKIDGMDLREIDLDHLRSSVGVVLQENFLFTGTIRDNIAAARPGASFDQIVRAAQLAGAEEFIERLPRGYETPIEEGAVNFSGGQRQRLAIARALLIDPAILILDEATSALDAESEAIVNANLMRIAKGRTVIIISHRLSSLIESDQILVLERGKPYDIGRHEALLGRCDIYQQLWHQQNRHLEQGGAHVRIAVP